MLLQIKISVGVRLRLRARPMPDVPTINNRRNVIDEKLDFDILLAK
jgi:hypothetical protein